MTYEMYRAAVLAAVAPGIPAYLAAGYDDLLYTPWADWVSVNDSIVQLRYDAACRKADRNC